MTRPTAAAPIWPYAHRTVAEVDRAEAIKQRIRSSQSSFVRREAARELLAISA